MPTRSLPEQVALVASAIGSIDPSHIEAIILESNSRGLLIHGIKRAGCFDRICREGVRPLTPEGGNVSFWASGSRIFGDASFPMGTYDAPFFNYAVARDDSARVSSMNLAMVDYHDVRASDGFEKDGVVCVPHVVEPASMYLLQLRASYREAGLSSANHRAQQYVAERLFEVMTSGNSWKGRIERVEI